jgi:hypothetical protein
MFVRFNIFFPWSKPNVHINLTYGKRENQQTDDCPKSGFGEHVFSHNDDFLIQNLNILYEICLICWQHSHFVKAKFHVPIRYDIYICWKNRNIYLLQFFVHFYMIIRLKRNTLSIYVAFIGFGPGQPKLSPNRKRSSLGRASWAGLLGLAGHEKSTKARRPASSTREELVLPHDC